MREGLGLSDVLAGNASLSEAAPRPARIPRLRVITWGTETSDALADPHDAAEHLVAELREEARYVVIEVQSVAEDAATFTLAEFADGALVTIEIGATRLPDAIECVRVLDRVRVPVLGAAVLPRAVGRRRASRAASQRPRRRHRPARGRSSQTRLSPRTAARRRLTTEPFPRTE